MPLVNAATAWRVIRLACFTPVCQLMPLLQSQGITDCRAPHGWVLCGTLGMDILAVPAGNGRFMHSYAESHSCWCARPQEQPTASSLHTLHV